MDILDTILDIFFQNPLAQTIGGIAAVILTIAGVIKGDKLMHFTLTVSFFFFGIHYYLLGFEFAALMNAFIVIRNIFLVYYKNNKWVYIGSCILPLFFLVFYYTGIQDVLISIVPAIYVIGLYYFEKEKLRYALILISMIWLFYAFYAQSLGGIFVEIMHMLGVMIGIFRILKDRVKS